MWGNGSDEERHKQHCRALSKMHGEKAKPSNGEIKKGQKTHTGEINSMTDPAVAHTHTHTCTERDKDSGANRSATVMN